MPILATQVPNYKSTPVQTFDWQTFVGGLNTLLQQSELEPQELAQADNLVLIGKGIPTKRWGIQNYFAAGATGSVRALTGFYKSDGTNELLSITDTGYLLKRNGSSFTQINGVSWPSGASIQTAQINDTIYIASGGRNLAKYSSPTLVGFATIAIPVIQGASNLSNASGTSTKGYKITAVATTGETLPSAEFTLPNQPRNLKYQTDVSTDNFGGVIRLQWTGVSTASGILKGFNIYGRDAGNETFIVSTDAQTTSWIDDGTGIPQIFGYPPSADSTGGITANNVIRFRERLIFAGIVNQPTMVAISATVPNQENFDMGLGGTYIDIEPKSGDNVTGLATYKDKIIVFKQNSIWQVTLSSTTVGGFTITVPSLQLITRARGCIAPNSIVMVENDIYYLSDRGVHSLGYQFGYSFDLLRTNEVSGKIRPYFLNLTYKQKAGACATYFDYKYFILFPGTTQGLIYDVLRQAWMGPWSTDGNTLTVYTDSSNNLHLLKGNQVDFNVDELSTAFSSDKGVAIPTTLMTKKETFGNWSVFKTLKNFLIRLKNVTGTVNVNVYLESRTGTTVTAKSFNIVPATGASGWGSDMWGTAQWGSSGNKAITQGADINELIRWARINQACRLVQINIQTTNVNDNYQLLALQADAKLIGSGFRPSQWIVVLLVAIIPMALLGFAFFQSVAAHMA